MASEGPKYPGTVVSLANAGTSENANAWVGPGNVGADDATEAQITAATYDSPDISEILVASNFGFTNVIGTINGITVEIDRRSIIAGSGADFRVQLANGTTFASLVGTNKAATATTWPSTTAVATYGGAADTWSSGLTAAQIKSANFAVFVSASAKIANADIGVDFIRVTVTYTDASVLVTPGVASLTTTSLTPLVNVSNHQRVTPGVASLTTTALAPTVTASDHQRVTPGVASLSLTAFAPSVNVGGGGVTVIPGTASVALSGLAPSVVVSDHQRVIPGAAALVLTPVAPAVSVTNHVVVRPGPAVLSLTTHQPAVWGDELVIELPLWRTARLNPSLPTPHVREPSWRGLNPGARFLNYRTFRRRRPEDEE